MQSSSLLLLLVAIARTVVAVQAEELTAETSVERPDLSLAVAAPDDSMVVGGADESRDGRESRHLQDVVARQGVPGGGGGGDGPGIFTLALGALNPMPYLLGGLNGVRQVMQQRLNPYHGANLRNNHLRQGTKFRHSRRPVAIGGNGGIRHGGGGGGGGTRGSNIGIRHVGSGGGGSSNVRLSGTNTNSGRHTSTKGGPIRDVRATTKPDVLAGTGALQSNSLTSGPTTTKQPSLGSPSPSGGPFDFGTPKPGSIVAPSRPNFHHQNNDNHNSFPSNSGATSADFLSSADPSKKVTRVINIQVPEEMQNLTILEISMKANGDVSISGHDREKVTPSPLDTGDTYPQYPPLLPGLADIFSEDQRIHGAHIQNNLYDSGFKTNFEGFGLEALDYQNPDFVSAQPVSINSMQDILRMHSVANTNNDFRSNLPIDWNSLNAMNNLQATVPNTNNLVQQSRSFLRNSPVPQFSSNILPTKQNQIYFVPVSVASPANSNTLLPQGRDIPAPQVRAEAMSQKQHRQQQQTSDSGSPVYYIDITIPGNVGGAPSVNTRHHRGKRSLTSLQFDGWYPMHVSDPMEDDPTIGYQPPPLERVHFSNEPVNKKPMFPVRPENPPVFVVRAEPRNPEYHSVYGTENVEYFHIHPQTNTVRAFRAPAQSVGAIRFVPAPQFGDDQQPSSRSQQEEPSNRPGSYGYLTRDFDYRNIPVKESGFADKSDTIDTIITDDTEYPTESAVCDPDCEKDMEGSFSETSHVFVRHPQPGFSLNQRGGGSGSDNLRNAQNYRHRPDRLPNRRSDHIHDNRSKSSRPALHELLGNKRQVNREPSYLGSATDSAGTSFIRKLPPPYFRYSTQSTNAQSKQASPSEPNKLTGRKSEISESTRPWFLIDTRSDTVDRRREPSIASYIHPETHSGDEKIHYKPFGPVSYVSKEGQTLEDHIHNPHLDDHMNSYKPTLTANSLSELLQIFRFTSVTDEPATEESVTLREFRYTRPTEEPPTTPSYADEAANSDIFPSSFRYTPSPSKFSEPTTEAGVTKKPPRKIYDAVADTNSLDGYLFSDSEASPEYAHPQVKPNVVIINEKEEKPSKVVLKEGSSRVSDSSSNNANSFKDEAVTPQEAFDGLEIIYSGPGSSSKRTTEAAAAAAASWPLYIIHQGHSKVQVYGINSATDSETGSEFTDIYLVSTKRPTKYSSLPASLSTNATTGTPPLTVAATTPSTSTIITTTPFSAKTTTTPSVTTTSPPTSTTSTTASTVFTNSTTITTTTATPSVTTSPYPVEPDSTTGITTTPAPAPATTTISPTLDYDVLRGQNTEAATLGEEYDYYYHDSITNDYHHNIPDLAFGEDYYDHPGSAGGSRGWFRPSLQLPGPPSLPHLTLPTPPSFSQGPPPPYPGDDQLSAAASFSHMFQDRLPQVGHQTLPQADPRIPLSPAVALSRAEFSVARPVFFTKRKPEDTATGWEEGGTQISRPFEYLSELRNLKEEDPKSARAPTQVEATDKDKKPVPQPRMKRLTEEPAEA